MPDNAFIALFALGCGVLLEATRRWMMQSGSQEKQEPQDDITAFRQELLEERHRLQKQREEWRDKYYDEREKRLKAEWQIEALKWVRSDQADLIDVDKKETPK